MKAKAFKMHFIFGQNKMSRKIFFDMLDEFGEQRT